MLYTYLLAFLFLAVYWGHRGEATAAAVSIVGAMLAHTVIYLAKAYLATKLRGSKR